MGRYNDDPIGRPSTSGSSASRTYNNAHRQTVPVADEADAPPPYTPSHSAVATPATTSPSLSNAQPTPLDSISAVVSDTPRQQPPSPSNVAYEPSRPMSVDSAKYKHDEPGCCCSSTAGCFCSSRGGCFFSDNEGCCFSDNQGCCFSNHGGCCFSDHGGCCFGDEGGCCFSSNGGCMCG